MLRTGALQTRAAQTGLQQTGAPGRIMTQTIFLAGHRGMVGSALLRKLEARQAAGAAIHIVTRTRAELDLTDAAALRAVLAQTRPDVVILVAAKVGGSNA